MRRHRKTRIQNLINLGATILVSVLEQLQDSVGDDRVVSNLLFDY